MGNSHRIIVHVQGPSGIEEVGTIQNFSRDFYRTIKPRTEQFCIDGVPVQSEWVYDQVKSILIENAGDIKKIKPYDFKPK